MNKKLLALYGLKWNPFSPEVPKEALYRAPRVDHFCWRMEGLARTGGFALVTGDVGSGKSVALRILVDHLASVGEVQVGVLTRPQGSMADFYREMGDLFGVALSPHNRWAGAKVLRERWLAHMESVLHRAVLVVDEAQEALGSVMSELRLLSAAALDARALLTVVLAGDGRLTERLRGEDLLPLSSRLRVRLVMAPLSPEELLDHLRYALKTAGNAQLMTKELMATLCEHAAGNLRVLMVMANELLDAGARQEGRALDEKLYLETFAVPVPVERAAKKTETVGRRR